MVHKKESIFLLQKLTISIVLVLCFTSSTLQATDEKHRGILEVYPQWYSDENYTLQGNIGIEKDTDWMQYYTKPSFAYALDNNWALHAGLGVYYTDYDEDDNNLEIRPFQGISHFNPLSEKWKLSSYLRLEERFQYDTDTWDKETSRRLRLRLRTTYKLNPLINEYSWRQLTFGIEAFKNYSSDDQDYESLLTFGLERNLSEQNKLRFELAWKYESRPGDISSTSANTVYFKIQYYPTWGERLRNRLSNRDIDE